MRPDRATRQSPRMGRTRTIRGAAAGGGGGGPYGAVWTQKVASTHPTSTVRHMGQVAFRGDIVVASAYDRTFVSDDAGATFTEYTVAGQSGYITASPDRFVAYYQSTGLWYSTDGINWTQSNFTSTIPGGVKWIPWASKFVATRSGNTETAVWSADGITWEAPEVAGIRSQQRLYVAPDHLLLHCSPTDFQRRCAAQGVWTTVTGANFNWWAAWVGSTYGWRLLPTGAANLNLYESNDLTGTAFTNLGNVMPSAQTYYGLAADSTNERLIAWYNGGATYSDDGGATWTAATGTVPAQTINPSYSHGNGGVDPSTGIVYAGGDALYASAA